MLTDLDQGYSGDQLRMDLQEAGLGPGELLLVHSSLKSIGPVKGGAMTVVDALVQSVSPGGTVFFPSLTHGGSTLAFLMNHLGERLDLRRLPAHTGAIVRASQEYPGAIRSAHPTHPVTAIGPLASWLCMDRLVPEGGAGGGGEGGGSPYYKASQLNGRIAMIGVDLTYCTTLHCVEEIASPYVFGGHFFPVDFLDMDGRSCRSWFRAYGSGYPNCFPVIEQRLLDAGIMTMHRLGQATLRLIRSGPMVQQVSRWLQDEPYLLVRRSDR